MSIQLAPLPMSLPPPSRLDLVDAKQTVGWIDGHALGFRGFRDEREAANAAWVAYRTVWRRLAQLWGTRPTPVDVEHLTLARDGARELILASGRPVAELLRPRVDSPSGPDSFGFEIPISPSVTESTMRDLTRLAYRTLRKSGIHWAMWRSRSIGKVTMWREVETVLSDRRIEESRSETTPVAKMRSGFARASGVVGGTVASLALLLLTLVASVSLLVIAFSAPEHFATTFAVLFGTLLVFRVVVLLGNWLPTGADLRDGKRKAQGRAEHFYRTSPT